MELNKKFSVLNIQNVAPEDWNSFVYNHPSSFLWHTYDLITAKSSWHNYSNESFAIIDDSNRIVGVLPLYRISSPPFRLRTSLENIGGWLCNREDQELIHILIQEYKKRLNNNICGTGIINFSTCSLSYDEDPLFLHGLPSSTARISVLNLTQDLSTLWSNIRKGHKADIKKAERQGLVFKKAEPEDLDTYYKMHENVCKKSSLKPHSKQYFEFIFKNAMPKKNAFVGLAYHKGKAIAAASYGIYKGRAVYWTGASFDIAYELGANHFLHWNLIQEMKNRRINFLDMGEIFFKHPSNKIQGIANFKRGFGGSLQPCFKSTITAKRLKKCL